MTKVHGRVHERHPEIDDADVLLAWENYMLAAVRSAAEMEIRLGFDRKGRVLEMIGVLQEDGWLVYHAFTPPTKKFLQEIDPKGGRS